MNQKVHTWSKETGTAEETVSIPEVCGGYWWAELHSWAENIRDHGCASCGEFAVMAAQAIHDVVNSELGKPLQHTEAITNLARAMLRTMETNPQFNNSPRTWQDQDEDLCELVPNDMTFEASLFHQDPASLE